MRRMPTSGQESTSLFGRVRHFVVTNKNLNAIQNEAVNFPVSSVASDLTVLSLLEIDKLIQNSAYSARIRVINNVHDSIIFECDDDKEVVDWLVYTGTTVMKEQPIKQFNCNVPFKADAETGYSWGELHGIV